jgi:hypothetical protein
VKYLNLQISPGTILSLEHNGWNKQIVKINDKVVSEIKASSISKQVFTHIENGESQNYVILKKYDFLHGHLFDVFVNGKPVLEQTKEPKDKKDVALKFIMFFIYVGTLIMCTIHNISVAIPICFLPVFLSVVRKQREKLIIAKPNLYVHETKL